MKKAKKLLVTLLILTFMLSTFNVGFAADKADEKLPTEVVRAQALGILKGDDQGNLNLDKPITRAEALALIIRISGLETSADLMSGQTRFADVNVAPSLQWATGYINLGVSQEIINGYPDGTFKGNDTVTYAEMAKMLIYAMNYGVTVEGAQWPAGVMAKADDLELFDKVNATPNLPALRGDVVKMIDNSLTVKHLVQTGYGDLKQYEEGDKTFLSKMNVDELEEVRVTEIARVNNKLDDDEIKLDDKVYTLKADIAPEAIFGLEVDAWVNDDDEVFFVKVETAEKDILFDTVENAAEKDIELLDADKTYKWAKDAVAYVNFKEVDLDDIENNAYGKVVLDRGEIIFASLFDFEDVGVVTKVDKKVIEFVNASGEDDLDLDDFDEVYIYNADFSKADVKDIGEDSAIFFWENDDDEVFIIVKNDSVTGEVDRVREDKIRIDGKEYKQGSYAFITLDKGDEYEEWDSEKVEEFLDEDAKIIFDLRGRVLLVSGASGATSGNKYGIVTYAKDGRVVTATVFNEEGKEVDYKAESRTDLRELEGLGYYNEVGSGLSYAVLKYKLNSDSEIAEDKFTFAQIEGNDFEGTKVGVDKADIYSGQLSKKEDQKRIEVNGKYFYITKDTVVMKAINKDGELDPEVIKTDRLISISVNKEAESNAIVFGKNGKDADFIVFLHEDFAGTDKDYLYGVVTDDPWKTGKNHYTKINVFGEGEKEYKLNDRDDFEKGAVVAFELNNKDEAVLYDTPIKLDIALNSYKDSYVTVTGGVYKVDSSAVLYNLDEKGKLDKKISPSKLDNYQTINYVLDKDDIIVAATVEGEKERAKDITKTVVQDILGGRGKVTAVIDIKKDDVVELVVYDADFVEKGNEVYIATAGRAGVELEVTGLSSGTYEVEIYVNDRLVDSANIRVRSGS